MALFDRGARAMGSDYIAGVPRASACVPGIASEGSALHITAVLLRDAHTHVAHASYITTLSPVCVLRTRRDLFKEHIDRRPGAVELMLSVVGLAVLFFAPNG
jgi:hypothetical protein